MSIQKFSLTTVKAERYFNWDNVPRKIFNSTIVKANWYFKYMGLYSVKVDICCIRWGCTVKKKQCPQRHLKLGRDLSMLLG